MLQVRDGNAAAFESLVEKHQKRLVMILEHLVSDRTLAEDLAQDVFLRVYRARERYVPTAKFSTWLYTIHAQRSQQLHSQNLTTKRSQFGVVTVWFDAGSTARHDGQRQK